MAGFDNDVVYGTNADFSNALGGTGASPSGELLTNGQLWIGSTAINAGGTHINVGALSSPGSTVTIGYSSPNITLEAGSSVPTTFNADVGSATPAANILILAGGTNGIDTTASGNTVTFNFDVTEQPTIATSYATPSGTAIASLNVLTFANGTGVSITAAGSTVTINAAASVPTTFTANTGSATPSLNNINILAAASAAGTSPATTSASGSTVTVNVQTSQAIASADATKIGLANFSSTDFSVTATGFVTLSTTGAGKTITGDSGGALSPSSNNWNLFGSGSITTSGSGSTLTTQLTGLTNHAVLVGAGTSTITKVGPTATAGQVLQSAGASADPVFSTATYPSTTTINQILYSSSNNVVAGITTANNGTMITSATGVPSWLANGTTGQVLTATTGSPPSWAAVSATSVTVTTYTPGSGTWNKGANTKYIEVYGWAGGGGGGSGRLGATTAAGGGAGGNPGGAFVFKGPATFFNSSENYVVGAGGAGGGAITSINIDGNPGIIGNDTTFGTILVGKGGTPGNGGTSTTSNPGANSGLGVITNYLGGPSGISQGGTGSNVSGSSCPGPIRCEQWYLGTGGGGGAGFDSGTARQGGTGGPIKSTAAAGIPAITVFNGAAGGIETGTIGGTNGSNSLTSGGVVTGGGGGGGGGGTKTGTVAGKGGDGGTPGGGGGGGGGGNNANVAIGSGAGGNGGDGKIIIVEFA